MGVVEDWGLTTQELNEILVSRPSARGMLFGFVAEYRLTKLLTDSRIHALTRYDDHDRSKPGATTPNTTHLTSVASEHTVPSVQKALGGPRARALPGLTGGAFFAFGAKRACIYALTDEAGRVRYVGKALRPRKRYRQHLSESGRTGRSHRANWLRSLAGRDVVPGLRILERCWESVWRPREQHWIASLPNLVNGTAGGDSPPTSFDFTGRRRTPIDLIRKQLSVRVRHATKHDPGSVRRYRAQRERLDAAIWRCEARMGRAAARDYINAELVRRHPDTWVTV